MAIWFISHNQGEIEWIKQQAIKIDHFVEHLEIDDIQADEIVIGSLPVHLAEKVCAKGADFYFLSVNVTRAQRGVELTAEQLTQQGCQLQQFYIEKC